MVNSGQVELLDHKVLRAQLEGLERRTARGGRDSIDHPPGGRDDVANAVAGAVVRAAKPDEKVMLYALGDTEEEEEEGEELTPEQVRELGGVWFPGDPVL